MKLWYDVWGYSGSVHHMQAQTPRLFKSSARSSFGQSMPLAGSSFSAIRWDTSLSNRVWTDNKAALASLSLFRLFPSCRLKTRRTIHPAFFNADQTFLYAARISAHIAFMPYSIADMRRLPMRLSSNRCSIWKTAIGWMSSVRAENIQHSST